MITQAPSSAPPPRSFSNWGNATLAISTSAACIAVAIIRPHVASRRSERVNATSPPLFTCRPLRPLRRAVCRGGLDIVQRTGDRHFYLSPLERENDDSSSVYCQAVRSQPAGRKTPRGRVEASVHRLILLITPHGERLSPSTP